MSVSITACCFDGYIIGDWPQDFRERKHDVGGHSSQIYTYMSDIEAKVTLLPMTAPIIIDTFQISRVCIHEYTFYPISICTDGC